MSVDNVKAAEAEDYARPERQDDLAEAQERVEELLFGHKVLNLGNDYWTPIVTAAAESVDAGDYTAVFSNWSHIKREDHDRYLADLRQRAGKDAVLVLLDESYVEGSSTVTARTDAAGNTYQIRTDAGGQRFELLKNYPSDSYLKKKLAAFGREIRLEKSKYYWLVNCRLK